MSRALLPVVTLVLAVLVACGHGEKLENRELTVACGMCILKSEPRGCYWAAVIDDKVVPVVGPGVPVDHDSHGPGGMCTMERRAIISGTLDGERIVADRFELLPTDDVVQAPAHDHQH